MIHHRVLAFAASSAAIAGLMFAAPAGAAGDVYAAIAFAPDTGSIGWAVDVDSRAEAEANATSQCADNGCEIVASVVNGCVALAVADDGSWAGSHGPDRATAEADALGELTNAHIELSRCTF